MKDKVYYYNHNALEPTIIFNEWPYFIDNGEFKNWQWEYTTQFGNLKNFRRSKQEFPMLVSIFNNSKENRDYLTDVFSRDLIAGKPGKLKLRNWTLECFIVQAKYQYSTNLDRQIEYMVLPTQSTWIKKINKKFIGKKTDDNAVEDLKRHYTKEIGEDIPTREYDYGYELPDINFSSIQLVNQDCGYIITIYGPVENPVIFINNHPIKVNVTVKDQHALEITSIDNEKTIYIISPTGLKTSAFVYRDKTYSPFIKLNSNLQISFGKFNFDLKIIEKRSEPTWI